MKKIITIIAMAFGLAAVGIAGYYIWQYYSEQPDANQPPQNPNGSNNTGNTGNPEEQPSVNDTNSKLKTLSDTELSGYFIKDSQIIGVSIEGEVINISEKKSLSSAKASAEILTIVPSFDGSWVLEKFGTNSTYGFSLYNTQSNSWETVTSPKIESADWSPVALKIAYLEPAGDRVNLGIFDINKKDSTGFKKQTLATLALKDADVTWLNPNELVVTDKPSKFFKGSAWKYKIAEKSLSPLILEEPGLWVKWNKKTQTGIKFTSNKLSLINSNGAVLKTIPFLTMPDKCVSENNNVYCAVPKSIAEAGLPDNYLKGGLSISDVFLTFDTALGELKTVSEPQKPFNAADLIKTESSLLFLNRSDNQLYELSI